MASSSGIPYLGSRISLISRAQIRYEGILMNIDTNKQTVSLANVRCFGTEDRVIGSEAIPPANIVYDFIVFEGKRIKDITVSELAGPDDPAIVAINPASAASQPISGSAGCMGAGPGTGDQMPGTNSYMMNSQSGILLPNMNQMDHFGASGSSGPNNSAPTNAGATAGLNMYMGAPMNNGRSGAVGAYDYMSNCNINNMRKGNHHGQNQYGNQNQPMNPYANNNAVMNNSHHPNHHMYNTGQSRRGGHYNNNHFGGSHYYGNNRHSQRVIGELNPQPNSTLKMMVQKAFNFEEANSKFDKLNLAQTTAAVNTEADNEGQFKAGTTPVPDLSNVKGVYDKKASFFDNISCDTLDCKSGAHVKVDPAKQRELDMQTFGSTGRQPRLGRPGNRMGYRSGGNTGGYYRRNLYNDILNNHMVMNGYSSMNPIAPAPVGFSAVGAQF